MFKQYIEFKKNLEQVDYIQEFWTDKWNSQMIEKDITYLMHTDYFKILHRYFPKNGRILEGGCGMAEWVRFYSQAGYEITGIDISKKTVERIKQFFPEIDVRIGDVRSLNFPDNEFDVYLSFGVIEHFEEGPKDIIIEAHRVLKPGGLFCVSVPYLNLIKKKAYRNFNDNTHEFPKGTKLCFYQYVLTKEELRQLLEPYFIVLKIYPINVGHTLKTKSKLIKNAIQLTTNKLNYNYKILNLLKRVWHIYLSLKSKEKYAHMIFAICKNKKY